MAKSPSRKIKKPRKKRDLVDLPGLNPRLFSRIKQEFHDIDYADKLDKKAQKWLSNFTEEDLGGNMKHRGEKIYKKVADRRAAWRRNNKRNFDIYSHARAQGKVHKVDKLTELDYLQNLDTTHPEEHIIELIDNKENIDILSFLEYKKLRNNLTKEMKKFYEEYYLEELLQDSQLIKK